MKYWDPLYTTHIELDPLMTKLRSTRTMIRPFGISQSVLPVSVSEVGALHSRGNHNLGVYYLMSHAVRSNPGLSERDQRCLLISAGNHDSGNPPFTHLSEPYLKLLTGRDGETFLVDIVEKGIWNWQKQVLEPDTEFISLIEECGLTMRDVVNCICGKTPLSKILHGSLDLDNCDNLARHYYASGMPKYISFNPVILANSFRFVSGRWWLLIDVKQEVEKWRTMRKAVYGQIYRGGHWSKQRMLDRIMMIAFANNLLSYNFFTSDDYRAFYISLRKLSVAKAFLRPAGEAIGRLLDRIERTELFEEVFRKDALFVSKCPQLAEFTAKTRQIELLEHVTSQLGLKADDLSFICIKDRGQRNLDLCFIDRNNIPILGEGLEDEPELYLVSLLANPQLDRTTISKAVEIVRQELNI